MREVVTKREGGDAKEGGEAIGGGHLGELWRRLWQRMRCVDAVCGDGGEGGGEYAQRGDGDERDAAESPLQHHGHQAHRQGQHNKRVANNLPDARMHARMHARTHARTLARSHVRTHVRRREPSFL
eukprot:6214397-Pleurochrysis_carterae.AAC.1